VWWIGSECSRPINQGLRCSSSKIRTLCKNMGTRYKRNFLPQSGECWAKYSVRCRVLNAKRMSRATLARAGRHYQTGIASHSDIDGDKRILEHLPHPHAQPCCRTQLPVIRLIARWTDIFSRRLQIYANGAREKNQSLGYLLAGSMLIGQ
jgi:hypothetical protein